MYSILVLQMGISPSYVLDEMELYEVETLMEFQHLKNKESWEQTRTMNYFTAQCQSTKKIDIKEMMPFPWDKGNEVVQDTEEDRRRIVEEMREIEKQLNNTDGK